MDRHHHHHHHHGRREEEEYPPPPPPPFYGLNEPPPLFPPPPHISPGPDPYPPPPPPPFAGDPPPPPPAVGHHRHHPHMPHFPPIIPHHSHHKDDEFANKPTVRVYSKAETNFSLTIRDGKVILARSDPSDPFQHWIRDERLSTRVKDEEGFPSFALINKATGQAMKHSIGATQPVQLSRYDGNSLDESVLWTESRDLGDSYRPIRTINFLKIKKNCTK